MLRVFSSLNFLKIYMKRLRNISMLALIAATLVFANSCREKQEQGPVLSVNPSELVLTRNAGDLLEFAIVGTAGDNELRNIRISQKPENGITSTLLDTTIYGSHTDFFYVYTVPSGTNRVLLTFALYDTDGKSFTTLRDLYINEGEYLTEIAGYDLYSAYSAGNNNAFRISNLTFYQLELDPDSSLIDLVEKDLTDDGTMSLALTSFSGIRFVRHNSFNYAQATATSAEASFTNSSAQQLIPNIAVNDILITKYDTVQNKYAVIKIMGVQDLEGSANDRYIFNIKK